MEAFVFIVLIILYLAVSMLTVIGIGCTVSKTFREEFIRDLKGGNMK